MRTLKITKFSAINHDLKFTNNIKVEQGSKLEEASARNDATPRVIPQLRGLRNTFVKKFIQITLSN